MNPTFTCSFCHQPSDFSRRAASSDNAKTANPYAPSTRKYRCTQCGRINEIEKSGYDWAKIDQATK